MPTVLQIISSLGVAAIIAAITYVFRLEKRLISLETVKLQIGEESLPKTDTEKFWDGKYDGWRHAAVRVTFPDPFPRPPAVMVALKRFDLGDAKANIHRIGVRADNVDLKGFQLHFETWHESLIFEAAVSWIAISQ
jgi:H-type lectin domain